MNVHVKRVLFADDSVPAHEGWTEVIGRDILLERKIYKKIINGK